MEHNPQTQERWKGTFGELEKKGEELMKWGVEGKHGYVYNTLHKVDGKFYHATLGPDATSEARFDAVVIPPALAIDLAVEELPISQHGNYLNHYFSERDLNDYKRLKGWSPEYSLEEISGYRALAEMAVTQLAGNIEMKPPSGVKEGSPMEKMFNTLVSDTIDSFIEKTAKDFSQKLNVTTSDLVKALENGGIAVGNASRANGIDTAFYCGSGKNNAQYLYRRGNGGMQLVASSKTLQTLPVWKDDLSKQVSKGIEM